LAPPLRSFSLNNFFIHPLMAAQSKEGEEIYYLIDRAMHEHLVESLADQGIHLRAATQRAEI